MTIDLIALKIKVERKVTMPTDNGPVDCDWVASIGVALPSWRFFPAAWTIVSAERRRGAQPTVDVYRWRVGDEFA
jgi:hypothetical protein